MHILNSMHILADRNKVIDTLKTNREKHRAIVVEARAFYIAKAREALMARLKEAEAGKVVSLAFQMSPPQDHTKVYDTAIAMLELHTEPTIRLDTQQVRNLMMDEWDWSHHFLMTNSAYSATAGTMVKDHED